MKKTIYTAAFIALFSALSHAQTTSSPSSKEVRTQQPAKAETVNPDGTTAPAQAAPSVGTSEVSSDKSSNSEVMSKPAGSTRMAITEKGVPAKKPAETKKTEPAKTEKH